MQLSNLFTDDRAVSPVIGVILMVAITVILAAVIGTFVLGLGDSVQQTTPTANFGFDFNSTHDGVVITHEGGDTISGNQLAVGGVTGSDFGEVDGWDTDDVSAGSSTGTLAKDGDTVRVLWQSQDGSSSATLASRDFP